ncbi:AraC family transcriptional regulator [Zunongwangia sp. F260]|uniref:AraC family transcriptional regulator n=1 Tax=Autumnicola lenta TaxID=3075593 RepID=A0ABU3CGV9_9FLAO|nr:AraC family transcriptional regulator [Zunongwangia sp. F260]MDT0645578.1 AraC family transcriptional regulator [Zunongwangia sp. F260]
MKLHFLDRSDLRNKSLSVHYNSYSNFLKLWHYHEQLELVVVLKSTGTRFVGDSIEKFSQGEIILLGKNLPHMWLNDKAYFAEGSGLKAEAVAVHFKQEFLGHDFFNIAEMKHIGQLFEKARRGIKFRDKNEEIISEIMKMVELDDFERVLKMLQVLNLLSKSRNSVLLSSSGFLNSFHQSDNNNLDKVYSYIFNNFKKSVSLEDVSEIAHMNPAAFSRFFKRVSRKTFSRYLNEIRVGYACKMLLEQKYSITDICYESGFNNLSNFNRQFKAITNYSPTEYLQDYQRVYARN